MHTTSRGILDKKIPEKEGQETIRNQLLANLSISPKDMQQEIQGLERELSRARVEKKASEVDELQMVNSLYSQILIFQVLTVFLFRLFERWNRARQTRRMNELQDHQWSTYVQFRGE